MNANNGCSSHSGNDLLLGEIFLLDLQKKAMGAIL